MTTRRRQVTALVVLSFAASSVVAFARFTPATQQVANIYSGDGVLNDLANYRKWKRVNDVPLAVSVSLAENFSIAGNGPFI